MADKFQEAVRSFDAYEVIGVVTPGVVVALMLAIEWPPFKSLMGPQGLSIGDFGLFILVAFVLGHLIQAAGNIVELFVWLPFGLPTNWVRLPGQSLVTAAQRKALETMVSEMEGEVIDLSGVSRTHWRAITARAYGRLKSSGRSGRADISNRTYGLCRGLSAAVLICFGWSLYEHPRAWTEIGLIGLAAAAALWRMRRAGVHYARALVLDFIDLSNGAS